MREHGRVRRGQGRVGGAGESEGGQGRVREGRGE